MLMISERQILACTVGTVGYLDFRSQVSLEEMEAFLTSYKEQLKNFSFASSFLAIENLRRETLFLCSSPKIYMNYFMNQYHLPFSSKNRIYALQEVQTELQLLRANLTSNGLSMEQATQLLGQVKEQFLQDYQKEQKKKVKLP